MVVRPDSHIPIASFRSPACCFGLCRKTGHLRRELRLYGSLHQPTRKHERSYCLENVGVRRPCRVAAREVLPPGRCGVSVIQQGSCSVPRVSYVRPALQGRVQLLPIIGPHANRTGIRDNGEWNSEPSRVLSAICVQKPCRRDDKDSMARVEVRTSHKNTRILRMTFFSVYR